MLSVYKTRFKYKTKNIKKGFNMTNENLKSIVIPHHTHDIGMLVLLTYPACDEWNLPLFCPHCQVRICEVANVLPNCGMTLYE